MSEDHPGKFRVPVVEVPTADGQKKEVHFTIQKAHEYWAEACRRDVKLYAEFMTGNTLTAFHKEWYDALNSGDRILLICFMQSGKTETVIKYLSWFMGHYPWHSNIIGCCQKAQAVERMSILKDTIQSPKYKLVFPWIEIDYRKPWTAQSMNIYDKRMGYNNFIALRDKMGVLKAHSCRSSSIMSGDAIGTRISGLAIVDDPHSDMDAFSAVARDRVDRWYHNTLLSRLTPHDAVSNSPKSIVITTRWAEDDLAGRIKDHAGFLYDIHEIPSEYINDDGERVSSWPERYSIEDYDKKIGEIGLRLYQASYLNMPNAFASSMFQEDWLKYPLPLHIKEIEFKKIIISVDPAIKVGKDNDYTAIAAVGMDYQKNYYLLELVRRRMLPRDLGDELKRMYARLVDHYEKCDYVIIEDAGQQSLLVDQVINETVLPIRGVHYKGDKEQRAKPLEAICNNGRFFADWKNKDGMTEILRKELLEFPFGRHDDTVDAVAQAINFLTQGNGTVEAGLVLMPAGLLV